MRGPYPGELRLRVIYFVEAGGSRREAAEQLQVSASSAIRWVNAFAKMEFANQCPVAEALPSWRSIHSRSSP